MFASRLTRFTVHTLVLMMLFVLALSACGGTPSDPEDGGSSGEVPTTGSDDGSTDEGAGGESTDAGSDGEAVHLRLGNHLTNEEWHAQFEELLAEYTAENPNVTIEQQSTAYGELQARVATDRMADEPPDIYVLPGWWLGNLVESGIPMPAPEDIAADVRENMTPGTVDAVTWDGQIYGVPLENNATLMIYNVPALEAAGYDRPPETMDELMEYSRNLTLRDDEGNVTQYGWSQWVGSLNYNFLPFASMLFSCGGELFDESGQAAFNSEAGVQILENQVALIEEGVFNPEITSTDWYSGRVAITILPNWTRSFLTTNANPEDYRAAPVPHCEGQESGAIVYTWFVLVNERSEHQEEAWDFVRWFTQPYSETDPSRSAQFYYDIASIMPSRRHDLDVMAENFSMDILPAYVESLEYAKAPSPVPPYNEIIEIVIAEMDNAWFMRKSAQQALDDAAAQANALLQAP